MARNGNGNGNDTSQQASDDWQSAVDDALGGPWWDPTTPDSKGK
jgi:hypothetical protein